MGNGHKGWRIVLLAIALVVLCSLWWISNIPLQSGIWSIASDCPGLSLGDAFNIDYRIQQGDQQSVGYMQYAWPGVPMQIVSWLAFRVARLAYPSGADPIRYSLQNPVPFWNMNQFAVLLLTGIGTLTVWWSSRRVAFTLAGAALLVFFTFRPAWTFGLLMLGNESFALLLGTVLFAIAGRVLSTRYNNLVLWIVLGILGGLAWLVKLNYIVWPIAVGVGLLFQLAIKNVDVRQFAERATVMVFSLAITFGIIGIMFLGSEGLLNTLRFHKGVLLHTGQYGEGTVGLVDWERGVDALGIIMGRVDLWVSAVFLVGLIVVILFRQRQDQGWLKTNLSFVTCLIAAVLLGYAAVIKHFDEHYLVPVVAVLPSLILWLGVKGGRRIGYVIFFVVVSMVCVAGAGYFQERLETINRANTMQKELQTIYQLPLGKDEVRLWSYRVNAAPYLVNATAAVSNIEPSYEAVKDLLPQDVIYDLWGDWDTRVWYHGDRTAPEKISWRYVIFDRQFLPTFASLPEYFKQNGSELTGFEQVLVISRKAAR